MAILHRSICLLLLVWSGTGRLQAACPGCTEFGAGVNWGTTTGNAISEASGLAVSALNPGVFWTHNDDGNDGHLYAFRTNGARLARFSFNLNLSNGDVEDMALGRGPVEGVSYLYLGDIGAANFGDARSSLRVLRIPEPLVPLSWENDFQNREDFTGVQVFNLVYPGGGSFDAETLLLDPISGDIIIGTKQNTGTRLYRANLNSATNNETIALEFLHTVQFASASGGAISANGGRIILRREDAAEMWIRCEGETVSSALSRPGRAVPVIGPPTEPNGEAIAFLPDNSGYLTISDSDNSPPVYFFPALCSLTAPGTEVIQHPQSIQAQVGTDVQLTVTAAGANLTYQWRLGGVDIPGANSPTLLLNGVQLNQAGSYTVFVSGDGGSVLSNPALLTVRVFPPIIVTQMPLTTLAATGSTVNLSVSLQGTPPFTYIWAKGKKVLPVTSATLSLTNVPKSAAGKYRVTVSNSAGKVISAYTKLKVLLPPVIALNPLSRTAVLGKNVTLRVRAKGSPRLRYQWLFNDTPIAGAVKSRLALKHVQPAQSGRYSVIVTNEVGTATSSAAELLVQ